MHKEQLNKHEAIKKAESMISEEVSQAVQLSRTAVLTKMFTYFKNGLHNSKPAKDYLHSRNLDPPKGGQVSIPISLPANDFKVSNILANDLLNVYLEDELNKLDMRDLNNGRSQGEPKGKLVWTESKVSLIELIQ